MTMNEWHIHSDFSEGQNPDYQLYAPDGTLIGRYRTFTEATEARRLLVLSTIDEDAGGIFRHFKTKR